jgi:zinc transporter
MSVSIAKRVPAAMPSASLTAPPPHAYGADENGLICGYRFQPGRPARAIPSAGEALAALDGPAGAFVWLHLNLSHAGAEAWLRAHAGLSDNFFEALHEGSRATRIERDGDALFAVVNDVAFDFSFEASDVATLWVHAGPGLVISARRHPLRAVDRLRMAVKGGEALDSSVALLDHLLRDQADELQRIVRRAADRVDDIEDALLAGQHDRHGAEVARLRRLMVRLQRLGALSVPAQLAHRLRQRARHIARLLLHAWSASSAWWLVA